MKNLSGLLSIFCRKVRRTEYVEGVVYAEDTVKKWISAFPELSLKDISNMLYDAHIEVKKMYDAEFVKGFDDYAQQIREFKKTIASKEMEVKKMPVECFKLKQFASVAELLPRI